MHSTFIWIATACLLSACTHDFDEFKRRKADAGTAKSSLEQEARGDEGDAPLAPSDPKEPPSDPKEPPSDPKEPPSDPKEPPPSESE